MLKKHAFIFFRLRIKSLVLDYEKMVTLCLKIIYFSSKYGNKTFFLDIIGSYRVFVAIDFEKFAECLSNISQKCPLSFLIVTRLSQVFLQTTPGDAYCPNHLSTNELRILTLDQYTNPGFSFSMKNLSSLVPNLLDNQSDFLKFL